MDSTLILSPPTSPAMEARSSVVVITLRAARAGTVAPSRTTPARAVTTVGIFIERGSFGSERVGAVGADGELELEQELVGLDPFGVGRVPVLAADLAELARPVG